MFHFGTAYVLFRGRYIRYFFDPSRHGVCSIPESLCSVLLRYLVVSQTLINSLFQPKAMTERTRDGGVEECKGFSPPNVPTTSASSTRLPLGSLDLNTRVPNTGTATPQRIRHTESQRPADLARKRVRYAQRTEGQRLHNAHEKRTR